MNAKETVIALERQRDHYRHLSVQHLSERDVFVRACKKAQEKLRQLGEDFEVPGERPERTRGTTEEFHRDYLEDPIWFRAQLAAEQRSKGRGLYLGDHHR